MADLLMDFMRYIPKELWKIEDTQKRENAIWEYVKSHHDEILQETKLNSREMLGILFAQIVDEKSRHLLNSDWRVLRQEHGGEKNG